MKKRVIAAHAAWVCCGLALQALAWGEEAVGPPADAQAKAAPTTKLRFERGYSKPGIESLRVVRREQTMNNVAGQVALNVGMLVLGGGRAGGLGMSNFSKTDLAGEPIEALQGNALAVNPAISDLNEALSKVATRIYSARAAQSHAEALTDGSTPEEIEKAGIVQAEADTPLYAGAWHLVYENLSGNDELFRLRFGAELGHAGFMRPPQACGYQSEPIAWTRWQADDWKVLREERAKAVGACAEVLGAAPEKFW